MASPETSELQTFVKVVQAGSFTRAAERLQTQKSHVSRVVSGLEAKLGVRLLERSTRSLHLTEIGRVVLERATGILAALEDTERLAQQQAGEPRGTLRLTCGDEYGVLTAGRWISSYLQRFPLVQVEADFTGRIIDIVHEGFDLAIRVGELPDSSLTARKLGDMRYGLFASPDYLHARGKPKSPDRLARHDVLVFNGGRLRGPLRLLRGADEVRVEAAGRLRANSRYALRAAALQGMGVAVLPLAMAAGTGLVRVLPDWSPAPVPVHALYASSRYLSPKVRAFVDHAVAHFEPEPVSNLV